MQNNEKFLNANDMKIKTFFKLLKEHEKYKDIPQLDVIINNLPLKSLKHLTDPNLDDVLWTKLVKRFVDTAFAGVEISRDHKEKFVAGFIIYKDYYLDTLQKTNVHSLDYGLIIEKIKPYFPKR